MEGREWENLLKKGWVGPLVTGGICWEGKGKKGKDGGIKMWLFSRSEEDSICISMAKTENTRKE